VDKRNLQSARLKAKARLARHNDKKVTVNSEEEEFKRAFIKNLMKDPVQMEYAMKNSPEAMSRLLERYSLKE